jgi:hypothetical protein
VISHFHLSTGRGSSHFSGPIVAALSPAGFPGQTSITSGSAARAAKSTEPCSNKNVIVSHRMGGTPGIM